MSTRLGVGIDEMIVKRARPVDVFAKTDVLSGHPEDVFEVPE